MQEFSDLYAKYKSTQDAEFECLEALERIRLDMKLQREVVTKSIAAGETTGDPIRDYVIVHKSDSQAAYDRYEQLNEAIVDKAGELFVGLYDTRERMIFGSESSESDYTNRTHLLCGLLTGESLRFVDGVCFLPCKSFNFVDKTKSFKNSMIGPLTETPDQFKSLLSVTFCTANWHADHPPHLYNQMSDRVIFTAGDQAVLDILRQGELNSYKFGLMQSAVAQLGTLKAGEVYGTQLIQNMFSRLEELAGRLQLT